MNTVLWILQIALALHTLMGAFWKFSNSVDAVPSLRAMPNTVWRSLGVIEIGLAIALVLPLFGDSLWRFATVGAFGIALEMLAFSVIHLRSGAKQHGQMIYWLVVAALAVFIAVTRL